MPENPPSGSHAEPNSGPMDWSRLALLDDGTPACKEMIRKLVTLFLDTGRTGMDRVGTAYREGRKPELTRALHKLKGGCGTVGAAAMFRLIEEMEALVDKGLWDELPKSLDRLEVEFGTTREALRSRLRGPGETP